MSSQKCLTVFKENKSILKTVSLTFRYCFVSTLIMLVIPGFPQAGCMVMRLGCNNVLVQGAYHCKCINHGSSNVNMNPLCLSAALGYNSTVKWTRCSSTYCEVTIKAVQLVCLGLSFVFLKPLNLRSRSLETTVNLHNPLDHISNMLVFGKRLWFLILIKKQVG
jgi:hypothetical protein